MCRSLKIPAITVAMLLTVFPGSGSAQIVRPTLSLFGDISYRSTNLYQPDYDFVGGWAALQGRLILATRRIPILDMAAYVSCEPAASGGDLYWENRVQYGAGLELRPSKTVKDSLHSAVLTQLLNIRVYAEFLSVGYPRDDPGVWSPKSDFRSGIEIWAPLNVDLTTGILKYNDVWDYLWGELWCDAGYSTTAFLRDDFDSWRIAAVVRAGVRLKGVPLLAAKTVYPMPYVGTDVQLTQWQYSWQNRVSPLMGIRLMPFQMSRARLLQEVRLYAEWVISTQYMRNDPLPGTPSRDTRVGVSFGRTW